MASGGPYDINDNDDDIDDDIQRLQIILQDEEGDQGEESDGALNEELQSLDKNVDDEYNSYVSRPSTCSDVTASSFPATSTGAEQDDIIYRLDPDNVNAESCLAMNRAYQEVLLDLLRQTEMSLIENRRKQRQLEEDVDEQCTRSEQKRYRKDQMPLSHYMAPYFKDSDGQAPPDNIDVQAKRNLREEKQHVKPKPPWSKVARKVLLNAVKLNTLEHIVRPYFSKMEIEQEKMLQCKNQEEVDACTERIEALRRTVEMNKNLPPETILKMVKPDKIDWMKISLQEFEQRYEPHECEQMWRNVLRPSINRDKWSPTEDACLFDLANAYKQRNWDKIAKSLGTNRTPFQCLQHFQKSTIVYDQSEWTALDDELLREVVETCRFGNNLIHWQQVSYYVEGRSASMCKNRWSQINPELKRGKWSGHEDCMLIAAVELLGVNDWMKVSQFVGGRSCQQCRERWLNSLDPSVNASTYTYEEDKKLLQFYNLYGPEWSKISSMMSKRTDSQVLNRYKKLMEWEKNTLEFFNQPFDVQTAMVSPAFDFVQEKGMYRIRLRPTSLLDACKKLPQSTRVCEMEWEAFSKSVEIENSDYDKQWHDRLNGDIIVPRPPPMRKYAARSYEATWNRRKNLQKLVQIQINDTLREMSTSRPPDPITIAEKVASTLAPVANVGIAKWEMISSAMKGKQPHEIFVRDLIKISQHISTKKEAPTEEDLKQARLEGIPQARRVYRRRKRKKVSPAILASNESRKAKLEEHGLLGESLRKLVFFKLNRQPLVPERGPKNKRKQKVNLFPELPKVKQEPEVVQAMNRKSLLLMLKSLDVDSEKIYHAARDKRKQILSFMKPSCSTAKKARLRQTTKLKQLTTWGAEAKDLCESVLAMREDLGVAEPQESSEEEPMEAEETEDVKMNANVVNELRKLSYNTDEKFPKTKRTPVTKPKDKTKTVDTVAKPRRKKKKRGRPPWKHLIPVEVAVSENGEVNVSEARVATVSQTNNVIGDVEQNMASENVKGDSHFEENGTEKIASNEENVEGALENMVVSEKTVGASRNSEQVSNEEQSKSSSSENVEDVHRMALNGKSSRVVVEGVPGKAVNPESSVEKSESVNDVQRTTVNSERNIHSSEAVDSMQRTRVNTESNQESAKTVVEAVQGAVVNIERKRKRGRPPWKNVKPVETTVSENGEVNVSEAGVPTVSENGEVNVSEAGVPTVSENGEVNVSEAGIPTVSENGEVNVSEAGVPTVSENGEVNVSEAGIPTVSETGKVNEGVENKISDNVEVHSQSEKNGLEKSVTNEESTNKSLETNVVPEKLVEASAEAEQVRNNEQSKSSGSENVEVDQRLTVNGQNTGKSEVVGVPRTVVNSESTGENSGSVNVVQRTTVDAERNLDSSEAVDIIQRTGVNSERNRESAKTVVEAVQSAVVNTERKRKRGRPPWKNVKPVEAINSGNLDNTNDTVSTDIPRAKTVTHTRSNIDGDNDAMDSSSVKVEYNQPETIPDVETPSEDYNKTLPYIPPNATNLQAFRALLFERRNLVDTAGSHFNPGELRKQLYRIKKKGEENPLMNVFGTADKLAFLRKKAETVTKVDEDEETVVKVDEDEQETEGPVKKKIKKEHMDQSRLQEYQENMVGIKQSREFQQLQARFQAVFTWPALLSTVPPPDHCSRLPVNVIDVEEEEALENEDSLDNHEDVSNSLEGAAANVDNGDADGNDRELTELEIINKMVDKILKEYQEQRSKTYVAKKPGRRSAVFINGCRKRERTRLLKRLGILERVCELETKEAIEKRAVSNGATGVESNGEKGAESNGEKGAESNGEKGVELNGEKAVASSGEKGAESWGEKGAESSGQKEAVSDAAPGTSEAANHTEGTEAVKRKGRPRGRGRARFASVGQPIRTTRVSGRSASNKPKYNFDDDDEDVDEIPRLRRSLHDRRSLPDGMKNKRLKTMLPEKMPELLSKIPDFPMLTSNNQVNYYIGNGVKRENSDYQPASPSFLDLFTATDITQTTEDSHVMARKLTSSTQLVESQVMVRNLTSSTQLVESQVMARNLTSSTQLEDSHVMARKLTSSPQLVESPVMANNVSPAPIVQSQAMAANLPSDTNTGQHMMVAVPVTVGGVAQIACVPVHMGNDGKVALSGTLASVSNSIDGTVASVSGTVSDSARVNEVSVSNSSNKGSSPNSMGDAMTNISNKGSSPNSIGDDMTNSSNKGSSPNSMADAMTNSSNKGSSPNSMADAMTNSSNKGSSPNSMGDAMTNSSNKGSSPNSMADAMTNSSNKGSSPNSMGDAMTNSSNKGSSPNSMADAMTNSSNKGSSPNSMGDDMTNSSNKGSSPNSMADAMTNSSNKGSSPNSMADAMTNSSNKGSSPNSMGDDMTNSSNKGSSPNSMGDMTNSSNKGSSPNSMADDMTNSSNKGSSPNSMADDMTNSSNKGSSPNSMGDDMTNSSNKGS